MEHAAHFEHPHARCLAVEVVAHLVEQAADQRGTHHRQLAGDRVQQADRVVVVGKVTLPLLFNEGEVDHLLVVARGNRVAHGMGRAACFVGRAHLAFGDRRTCRDALEAVDAGHFLDQVFLDLEVEAIARRRDHEHFAVRALLACER